jgi:ATP-dependent DNA helicase RecG
VRTENSNKPHGFGAINPDNFTPFPKNPVIGRFFRQIGWADELGSGMRKLMKYGKAYGGVDPEMVEDDVFRIIVKVPEFSGSASPRTTGDKAHDEAHDGAHDEAHDEDHIALTDIEQRILTACLDEPQGTSQLLELLGYSSRTGNFKKALSRLLEEGLLERTIPEAPRSKQQKYRLTKRGRMVPRRI